MEHLYKLCVIKLTSFSFQFNNETRAQKFIVHVFMCDNCAKSVVK